MKLRRPAFLKTLFVLLLAIMMYYPSFAQIPPQYYAYDFSHLNEIAVTYFVVVDPKSPEAQKYFNVLKDVWKLSKKVEMIDKNTVFSKLSRDALFIYPSKSGYRYWCISANAADHQDKLFREGKKEITLDPKYIDDYLWEGVDRRQTPRSTMAASFDVGSNGNSVFEIRQGNTIAWGPGFFKNCLQNWQNFIAKYAKPDMTKSDKKKEMAKDMKIYVNTKLMDQVKQGTLYVPDYVPGTLGDTTGKDFDKEEAAATMKYYKHNWKMMTSLELDKKILNDKTPFYYLRAHSTDLGLFLYILNSQTGELAYSQFFEGVSYFAPGWIKKMSAEID